MASGQIAVVCEGVARLFRSGPVAGLSEGQLLDRFVARGDSAAFEAIVTRHGPLVLSVCRAYLRDPNDVDDAFQATFLVLVRKAGTLRDRDRLGNWLHGVARRVAGRARVESHRRSIRDGVAPEPIAPPGPDPEAIDLPPMIHDEVGRLSESDRAAVVLCFFEGLSHAEAADRLGWPIGTVKGRLARAKERLRARLSRRGVALPAVALLAVLARRGEAAVLPRLFRSTLSAATSLATGPGSASALGVASALGSSRAILLSEGALHAMSLTKSTLAASLCVAAGLLAGPAASAYQGFGGPPTEGPRAAASPPRTSKPGGPSPTAGVPAQEARKLVELAEQALDSLKKLEANGGVIPATVEAKILWQRRLLDAQAEAGLPQETAAKALLDGLAKAEADAKKRLDSGELSTFQFAEIQYQRLEAEAKFAKAKADPKVADPTPALPGMMGGGRSPAGAGMMGMPGMGGMAPGGGAMMGGMGGQSFEGGGGAAPPRRVRKPHPADLPRNKEIEEILENPIAMKFPVETPLEDVLKYIKDALTEGGKKKAIPIYVDPLGLSDADKTMTSAVSIDLDDVPLRTTLRLMLNQLHLDYRVRDGMLYISDRDYLDEEDKAAAIDERRQTGGLAEGFMGMYGSGERSR